jgi:hypothetical protein
LYSLERGDNEQLRNQITQAEGNLVRMQTEIKESTVCMRTHSTKHYADIIKNDIH